MLRDGLLKVTSVSSSRPPGAGVAATAGAAARSSVIEASSRMRCDLQAVSVSPGAAVLAETPHGGLASSPVRSSGSRTSNAERTRARGRVRAARVRPLRAQRLPRRQAARGGQRFDIDVPRLPGQRRTVPVRSTVAPARLGDAPQTGSRRAENASNRIGVRRESRSALIGCVCVPTVAARPRNHQGGWPQSQRSERSQQDAWW